MGSQIPVTDYGGAAGDGLGSVHTVTKELARNNARELRLQVQSGLDPIEEQQKAKRDQELARSKEVTFQQAAQEWMATKDPSWEKDTAAIIKRQLENHVYPRIGADLNSAVRYARRRQ